MSRVSPGSTGQIRIWRSSGQGQGHRDHRGRKFSFPQSTSIAHNSGAIKNWAMRFAWVMWSSCMADPMVWPPFLPRHRKWPRTHSIAGCNTITFENIDVCSLSDIRYIFRDWRVKFAYEGHRVKVKVKVTGTENVDNLYSRKTSIAYDTGSITCYDLDPSAAEFRRRRQPEACRVAAAEKNSARRRASRNSWTPPPPYFSRRAAALLKNRVGVNL